jgi:hypothetical protein
MADSFAASLDQPANAGVLGSLRQSSWGRAWLAAGQPPSAAPAVVPAPYYQLGTHPDLVARLWAGLGAQLPEDCRRVVYGRPALVHPRTGVVFAFAVGTGPYALRLPEPERRAALGAGAARVHVYADGTRLALDDVGAEWVFGRWLAGEERWCLAAYRFAQGEPAAAPE